MKRINITSIVLLIYLAIMSVVGWPGNKPNADYLGYATIIGVTLIVIILLRFMQIKRLKTREKFKKENTDRQNRSEKNTLLSICQSTPETLPLYVSGYAYIAKHVTLAELRKNTLLRRIQNLEYKIQKKYNFKRTDSESVLVKRLFRRQKDRLVCVGIQKQPERKTAFLRRNSYPVQLLFVSGSNFIRMKLPTDTYRSRVGYVSKSKNVRCFSDFIRIKFKKPLFECLFSF